MILLGEAGRSTVFDNIDNSRNIGGGVDWEHTNTSGVAWHLELRVKEHTGVRIAAKCGVRFRVRIMQSAGYAVVVLLLHVAIQAEVSVSNSCFLW